MKRWFFVFLVIEMVFVVELFFLKYVYYFYKEFKKFFEKCLIEIVKCFEDLKFEDKDCIVVYVR